MFCLALSYNAIPRFHKTNMYRKLHLLFSVLCVYVLTTESVFFVFCRFHLDILESHSLDGYCLLLVLDDSEKGMRELHISHNHQHVMLLRYNIRASVDVGTTRVKSHVICVQNSSKLGEKALLGLQNTLTTTFRLIYLAVHKPNSLLPASSLPRENPLIRDFSIFVPYSSSSSSVNPLSPYQNKPRR